MVIHGRSLTVPSGAGGLVPALIAWKQKDKGPFDAWMRTGWPFLLAALVDWLGDPGAAEDLAGTVLRNAFLAVANGAVVHRELPWLARIARNARIDVRRERTRHTREGTRLASLSLSLSLGVALRTPTPR